MTQAREATKTVEPLPERAKQEDKKTDDHFRVHPFLDLQRAAGNRAVVQLPSSFGPSQSSSHIGENRERFPLVSTVVQPKLKFGAPRDSSEEEADRFADQVSRKRVLSPPETPARSADQKTEVPESKEKVFSDVVSAVKPDLDQAWSDATRTWKEWGGFIVKNKTSGEVKVDHYKEGQRGMTVEWQPWKHQAPKDYELIGEFHTHQFSPREVKNWQKDAPSFTGESVGFDTDDLLAASKYFKEDYVAIVVSGKTIFGLVVSVPKLAEKFAQHKEYGAAAIDEADFDTLDDFKRGKITGDYSEKTWENLQGVVANYEKEMGKPAGIEFFRLNR
jgi:hypothetical protein